MSKPYFITRVQGTANMIAQTLNQLRDVADVYNACGYYPGGDSAITEQDLIDAGVAFNTIHLGDFATACGQILRLMDGETTTPGNHSASVHRIRNDS